MTNLDGKTALVTGSSRGIGAAIAQRLAADGARVIVHYSKDEAAARATVASIEQRGGQAFAVRAELGVPGDVQALFAGVEQGLAGKPLDILVTDDELSPAWRERLAAADVKLALADHVEPASSQLDTP